MSTDFIGGKIVLRGKTYHFQYRKNGWNIRTSTKQKTLEDAKSWIKKHYSHLELTDDVDMARRAVSNLKTLSEEEKNKILFNGEKITVSSSWEYYTELLKVGNKGRHVYDDNLSPRTLKHYKMLWDDFTDYLKAKKITYLNYIKQADIEDYMKGRNERVSAITYNSSLGNLQSIYAKLSERMDTANYFNKIIKKDKNQKAKTKKLRGTFTPETIKKLLDNTPLYWQCFIAIGMETPHRLNTIACLKWDDIKYESHEASFLATKTGKKTLSYIPKSIELIEKLSKTKEDEVYLFPIYAHRFLGVKSKFNPTGGMLPSTASRDFSRILDTLGIKEVGKSLSFHDLRRFYATRLEKAMIDRATIQETLGHASEDMTAGYINLSDETQKQRRLHEYVALDFDGELDDKITLDQITDLVMRLTDKEESKRTSLLNILND